MNPNKFARSAFAAALITAGVVAASTIPGHSWAQGQTEGFSRFATPKPAIVAGQSATLLPNGRWLIVGGASGHPSSQLLVTSGADLNSPTQPTVAVLVHARSGQTATVLPNGKVLIVGGEGSDGRLVATAELFDPESQTVQALHATGLTPRVGHTATLLTDGRMLLAGGVGADGKPVLLSELFDSRTLKALPLVAELLTPRSGQQSSLLANGKDLVWGGQDRSGKTVDGGELFDPLRSDFANVNWWDSTALPPVELAKINPQLEQSLPHANATNVAVDSAVALRFSEPMRVTSIRNDSVSLVGPDGAVDGKVVPAENGMLAFFTPAIELRPDTTYTLFVKGAVDAMGRSLPFTTFSFTTRKLDGSESSGSSSTSSGAGASAGSGRGGKSGAGGAAKGSGAADSGGSSAGDDSADSAAEDADEDWIPQEANRHGKWRVLGLEHDPVLHPEAMSLPLPEAAAGVTAVSGRVLRMNGLPLAGVAVSAYGKSAVTNRDGQFLLAGLQAGPVQLKVDGTIVQSHGRHYTSHYIEAELATGKTSAIHAPIYLPRVDPASEVSISSPADHELVLTHPAMPGLEVHIPKGAVLREYDGKIVTKLSITPIPVDRAPYPAPVPFSTYFTLQPGGAYVDGDPDKAVRIVYPNYPGLSPGASVNFWNYDPSTKGWRIYGKGHVTANGKQIVPNPGVGFRQIMTFGFGVNSDSPAPDTGPSCPSCDKGDPVDVSTGLFIHEVTDISLPDVMPIALSRAYHQNDPSFHEFGLGTTMSYAMYIENGSKDGTYGTMNLVLSNGTRIPFALKSGSAGSLSEDNVYINTSPTEYQGALMTIDRGLEQFYITMRGGTKLTFSTSHNQWSYNQLQSITDANGNTVTLTIPYSDILGRGTTNSGLVQRITSPNGRYISLDYDTCTDQNNVPHQVIFQATDNIGRTSQYKYDAHCRLHTAQDLNGYTETYDYDSSDRMTLVTDKNGNPMVSNDKFDSFNRVTQQSLGSGADKAVWHYTYTLDASNNYVVKTKVVDPNQYTSIYQFGASGQLFDLILAQGAPEQKEYSYTLDAASRITDVKDNAGRITHYAYWDQYGGPTAITYLYNTVNSITYQVTYDPVFHNLASVLDPMGNTTRITYNAQGRPFQLIDGMGYTTTLGYGGNGQGQPTSFTDANGHSWQFSYSGGDLASVSDQYSHATKFFTDAVGRLISVKDPLGRSQTLSYDNMNQLTQVSDALLGVSKISYDHNGNSVTTEDARQVLLGVQGKSHGFAPDLRNRMHIYTDPLGKTATYGFDGMSNVTSLIDRNQNTTTLKYDGLNRPVLVKYQGGSTVTVNWLDSSNQIQLVDSQNGTITVTYDDLFRTIKEVGPQGEVDYTYDNDNRRKTMTVGGQPQVKYSYYNNNWLKTITQGANVVTLKYDNGGRPSTMALPNGVVATYVFDNADRLQSISYANGSAALGNIKYGYDDSDHVVSIGGSLSSFSQPSKTAQSVIYDEANRMSSWGGSSASYDSNGNIKGIFGSTFVWDDRNHLASVNGSPVSYDAIGRRVAYSASGVLHTTQYDGTNPVLFDGSSFMLSGTAVDQYFAQVSAAGVRDVLSDGLGGTLALTDTTGAAVSTHYSYDSYGNTVSSGVAGIPVQFAGRENDGANGMYYYRNRYYMPQIGRFMSQDPLGLRGGINLYAYVNGNPVGMKDPNGTFGIAGAGIGAGLNFGVQMAVNMYLTHGDWSRSFRCVNWTDVAVSAALGAVGPGLLGNVILGKAGPAGLTQAQNSFIYFTKILPAGNFLKKGLPPLRPGSDCECKDLTLTSAISQLVH